MISMTPGLAILWMSDGGACASKRRDQQHLGGSGAIRPSTVCFVASAGGAHGSGSMVPCHELRFVSEAMVQRS